MHSTRYRQVIVNQNSSVSSCSERSYRCQFGPQGLDRHTMNPNDV
jgi:hypothetical protein